MANKIILNESDLRGLLHDSVVRALQENRMMGEIKQAQKELYQMSSNLTSIGFRLEDTKFQPLYIKMKNAMVRLNNALIKEIRKEKQ